jgi:hypothetical protein
MLALPDDVLLFPIPTGKLETTGGLRTEIMTKSLLYSDSLLWYLK